MLNYSEKQNQSAGEKARMRHAFMRFATLGLFDYSQKLTELFQLIVQLSMQEENSDLLLAALFQFSGVILPITACPEFSQEIGKLLEQMCKGEIIVAHCLTEKEAGTDSMAMKTEAVTRGADWVINGHKAYICNAPLADFGLVYAKSNVFSAPIYDLLAVLLDFRSDGISTSPPYSKLGLEQIPMSEVFLNNTICPQAHVLGHAGIGYSMLQMSTTYERIVIPLSFIGRMKKIYNACHAICSDRHELKFYLQAINLKINVAQAFVLQQLQPVLLTKWSRTYIAIGCKIKIFLTDTYLEVIELARHFHAFLSYQEKHFMLEEKKAAIAAWIYSGTNDSLRSLLEKLDEQ